MTRESHDRPKGLLVDLDGTLADTLPALRSVYTEFLRDHGCAPADSEFDDLNGVPIVEIIRTLRGRHHLEADSIDLERDYLARVADACEKALPSPGAPKLLRGAAARGYDTAVVTSGSRDAALLWLERNRLTGLVRAVVGGQEVREGKPSPEPYRLALDRIGALAADSIAIEDSRIGAQSAIAAGIPTYVLASGRVALEERWPGVAGVVEHLADVVPLL